MSEFRTPPPMERGDRIAVVAPAAGTAAEVPHVYEEGLQNLRDVFDLEPVEYPTTGKDSEYLAAHPEERAADVEDAFRDPEIHGVVATIGGADQIRILEHLDATVLRENPTRFYGYSDNTNLQALLWQQGVVAWQGPCVLTQLAMPGGMHDYTVEHVERAFFGEPTETVEPADRFTDERNDWREEGYLDVAPEMEDNAGWHWHNEDADPITGRIWGGCLETLSGLLMADRCIPAPDALDGAVLFVETAEEVRSAAWVTGVLQSMGERGLLERFAGFVVGRAAARNHIENPPSEERRAHRERQREAVRTLVERYNPGAPVLFDYDCGHTDPMAPIPLGARVMLDPGTSQVEFRGA